jgi:hypothetical protein
MMICSFRGARSSKDELRIAVAGGSAFAPSPTLKMTATGRNPLQQPASKRPEAETDTAFLRLRWVTGAIAAA